MFDTKDSVEVRGATDVGDIYLRNYMVKVYQYMTAGLLVSALFGWIIANVPAVQQVLFNLVMTEQGNYIDLTFAGWIVTFLPLALIFIINPMLAKGNVKGGFALFMLFSAAMGLSMANILLVYTATSIARVFTIAAAMFAITSFYGSVTKKDLTSWGSFLIMGLIGVIIAAIVNIFMQSPMLYFVYSIIGVVLFVGLAAYDTQRIKAYYNAYDSTAIMQAKAINGALSLYLDFINLFIFLLNLLGDRK